MIRNINEVLPLAASAVSDPKGAARAVLNTPMTRQTVIRAAMFIIVVNLILGLLADMMRPLPPGAEPIPTFVSFLVNLASYFGSALLLFAVGRAFGGRGDFHGSLKIAAWFAFLMLLAQGLALFALAISEAFFLMALIALMIFGLVQMTAQAMELHGFSNAILVFFGILASGFVFAFVMLLLLAALGVQLPATAPPPT